MTTRLPWPTESAKTITANEQRWFHTGSNICLDFHGDPIKARLAVFSDGNHHMALEATLRAFCESQPDVHDVFYATTPPNVLINYLSAGKLHLGNLSLSRLPDVFISPANVMEVLLQRGLIQSHSPFMQSRGNVLLIRKQNPKQIQGIEDLLRKDVRLFISNPETEKASYSVYRQSLLNLAVEAGLNTDAMENRLNDTDNICFGELIHHREAPQSIFGGQADVAMIYYHLALRYTRIFPNLFDYISLGGHKTNPQPSPGNLITAYHIALINDGGEFGKTLFKFMFDEEVTRIYSDHGLKRS